MNAVVTTDFNPLDEAGDADSDGLWNVYEYQQGYDIRSNYNAQFDQDGDGIPDIAEIAMGLNYQDKHDGADDPDGDFLTNREEYTFHLRHDQFLTASHGTEQVRDCDDSDGTPLTNTDGSPLMRPVADDYEVAYGQELVPRGASGERISLSRDNGSDPSHQWDDNWDGDSRSNFDELYPLSGPATNPRTWDAECACQWENSSEHPCGCGIGSICTNNQCYVPPPPSCDCTQSYCPHDTSCHNGIGASCSCLHSPPPPPSNCNCTATDCPHDTSCACGGGTSCSPTPSECTCSNGSTENPCPRLSCSCGGTGSCASPPPPPVTCGSLACACGTSCPGTDYCDYQYGCICGGNDCTCQVARGCRTPSNFERPCSSSCLIFPYCSSCPSYPSSGCPGLNCQCSGLGFCGSNGSGRTWTVYEISRPADPPFSFIGHYFPFLITSPRPNGTGSDNIVVESNGGPWAVSSVTDAFATLYFDPTGGFMHRTYGTYTGDVSTAVVKAGLAYRFSFWTYVPGIRDCTDTCSGVSAYFWVYNNIQ